PSRPSDSLAALRSQILDRLEHLRDERGSRPNQRRSDGARTNSNGRVVRTETAGAQRIVGEFVSVAVSFVTAASASGPTATGRPRRCLREGAATRKQHPEPQCHTEKLSAELRHHPISLNSSALITVTLYYGSRCPSTKTGSQKANSRA